MLNHPKGPDAFSVSWRVSLAAEDSTTLSIWTKVTFKVIQYAKKLELKEGEEARHVTSPLTSQYTYLCMNICSAWGYFQPGVVQTQGHGQQCELQQHYAIKVDLLF